jgi:ribose transport system substrate-binding protein
MMPSTVGSVIINSSLSSSGDRPRKRITGTIIVTVLVTTILCSSISGIGCRTDDPSKGKTIGVTLLNRGHLFYRDLEEGLQRQAALCGFSLIVTSADFDLSKQVAQVEDFIARKVDAIIICPVDSRGVGPAIMKAKVAGIPVFTADIAAREGEVVSHIASDNVAGGRLAGEYLGGLLNGKGRVAIINQPAISSVLDRVNGFRDGLARYPDITIVADVNGEGVRDKAMQAAADVLQAQPNLDGIFGINDDSALGALDAVQQFGRTQIAIVGYDATPPAREAILKGTALKADVIQYPELIGRRTIEAIDEFFAGRMPAKIIPVEVGVVDRDSLMKQAPQ